MVQGPAGTQVDAAGMVSGWTPPGSDIGSTFAIEIEASNALGSDTESWEVLVKSRADFDGDDDVDQEDFGHFQACYSGSGNAAEPGCEDAALDSDEDVDHSDFGIFQSCMGGANQPPGC